MLTQDQTQQLADAYQAQTLNANNFGSNLSKRHELVTEDNFYSLCAKFGLDQLEAETIAWDHISRAMRA